MTTFIPDTCIELHLDPNILGWDSTTIDNFGSVKLKLNIPAMKVSPNFLIHHSLYAPQGYALSHKSGYLVSDYDRASIDVVSLQLMAQKYEDLDIYLNWGCIKDESPFKNIPSIITEELRKIKTTSYQFVEKSLVDLNKYRKLNKKNN